MSKQVKISLTAIIVFIIIGVIWYSAVKPIRSLYPLPDTDIQQKNWNTLFSEGSHIDQFKVLNTGSVKVPIKGMLNEDKLKEAHGLKKYLWVDVFAFLFHHTEKGWFLIDTGLDRTFQGDGNIKGLLASNYIIDSRQKKAQNIAAQMEREGKNIKGIFFTHLHGDHTAGLAELAPSIPKYVGKGDEYLHLPLLYYSNHLSSNSHLIEIDWTKGIKKSPFDRVIDIFGDGSILGIHTPGHSKSHFSYLLMTVDGPKLLTGDASHTKYGFLNQIEPGWVEDQAKAAHSLEQLVEFHERYPKIEVIYGHER